MFISSDVIEFIFRAFNCANYMNDGKLKRINIPQL